MSILWKDGGPPKESNYDVASQQIISAEKNPKRKDCLAKVQDEVQKLLKKEFFVEVQCTCRKGQSQHTRIVSTPTSGFLLQTDYQSSISLRCLHKRTSRERTKLRISTVCLTCLWLGALTKLRTQATCARCLIK